MLKGIISFRAPTRAFCRLAVVVCNVAKQCVLEQKLLLTA